MQNIKTFVIDLVIKQIETQIKDMKLRQVNSSEESKKHKGAMSSRYDTFKEEAQYLTGGYTVLLTKLRSNLRALKSVRNYYPSTTKCSVCTIVEVKNLNDNSRVRYFLLPTGGGNTYEIEKEKITTLNIRTPLARSLIGSGIGDDIEVNVAGTTKYFNITSIT